MGAEQAGDVGADDLMAGGRSRKTHGGAQSRGAETAGTFGEAVEICVGAAKTQQAERVRPRTSQGQEQEVDTGPPRTPAEQEPGGSLCSEPSRTRPGTGAGSGGSPSTSPSWTGTKCEGGSAWDPSGTGPGTGSGCGGRSFMNPCGTGPGTGL
ncbi:hypothetical protein AMECASPLE_032966 [Ameca splendens]|uniref:Uncharacterized protein n=1 Tax=Ameca splendens TaxID=208324 RepID=A0ABV0XJM6_9TELE